MYKKDLSSHSFPLQHCSFDILMGRYSGIVHGFKYSLKTGSDCRFSNILQK